MPAGDRTGPWGAGPRTGRGFGYCSGYAAPGHMNPGPGLGLGRGFGRGFGLGRGYGRGLGMGRGMGRGMGAGRMAGTGGAYVPPDVAPPAEGTGLDQLKRDARALQDELKKITARIAELEKAEEKE